MYFDKGNLDIKKLNFWELQNTIHLSLSEKEYPFLDDSITLNKAYFSTVHENAINIFEDLFSHTDSIKLVQVVYSYNTPYRKTNIIKKFTSLSIEELSYFKEYLKVNDDTALCDEFAYHCSIKDIKYKKLLKAIANQDFKGLVPNINQDYNFSEIYILNRTKNLLYHLYDDRGLWVAFNNNEDFLRFSKKYNHLILEIENEGV
ncbi:DUF3885 domain-containing protein [Staphylococcus coagulans]|uniref:DUF3885 domain-containing protein n=2 Tax=Staphylococcus coagulans TaxID=74706 RepID=UPI00067A3215|nr:DUF3885 domain-containing protein [Staphylococcus coagulans]AKS67637.1 hypothetical protein LH95_09315 [Staphylococcus schleiferi]MBA8774016.1 DUF3885 domain-containing protein [Staphylococcus coagulans]MBT2813372.1 DUF3885 domain-containing protein [Staphylococcus coagulans]MBT2815635.1 DUF3885 domain-containing protein [Staphylococcus coagulans]MBT2836976.1 DUF3885 domain-containing protein [Staphylococcus coagulans]